MAVVPNGGWKQVYYKSWPYLWRNIAHSTSTAVQRLIKYISIKRGKIYDFLRVVLVNYNYNY